MKESEKMQAIVAASQQELQASTSLSQEFTRRSFLRQTVALAGGAGTLGMASTAAMADPLPIPASNQTMARPWWLLTACHPSMSLMSFDDALMYWLIDSNSLIGV